MSTEALLVDHILSLPLGERILHPNPAPQIPRPHIILYLPKHNSRYLVVVLDCQSHFKGYIVNRYPTIAAALLPSLRMDRVPCLEGRISGTTMPTALDRFRVHERAGFNLKRLEDSSWGNLPRSLSASFRPFDIPVYMYRRVPIKLRE